MSDEVGTDEPLVIAPLEVLHKFCTEVLQTETISSLVIIAECVHEDGLPYLHVGRDLLSGVWKQQGMLSYVLDNMMPGPDDDYGDWQLEDDEDDD